MAKESVNFRLDPALRTQVRALAKERRWSESATIEFLVIRGMQSVTLPAGKASPDSPPPKDTQTEKKQIASLPPGVTRGLPPPEDRAARMRREFLKEDTQPKPPDNEGPVWERTVG